MFCFVGLMDDVKLADRMRNLRKNADDYARKSSKTPKDFALKLVPVTEQEVFGVFKDGIEFDMNDPGRHIDTSLKPLLESAGLARFDIPNDALHLRRKTDSKEILEIVANSAHVNYISRFVFCKLLC